MRQKGYTATVECGTSQLFFARKFVTDSGTRNGIVYLNYSLGIFAVSIKFIIESETRRASLNPKCFEDFFLFLAFISRELIEVGGVTPLQRCRRRILMPQPMA